MHKITPSGLLNSVLPPQTIHNLSQLGTGEATAWQKNEKGPYYCSLSF